ncbi:uncharacterized protein [Physcomitrium patens]|nr:uncharacterized protein LOC112272915 isoform X4 [Physcomitrium patens]XP_024356850.1 uncharacterized protein LOC112272915 isoform X4 [Physcomitrium patens]XP_024356851.1 uncharacterized protein LOC112272915 isoform X4 [Physcomitrium patens]XP_024356852.1 uncharacterized protein LOC112272915 isoform X4 [Physcomitrium patens]|eukprot:XP_024356849.1 uncharacterized protein LOC112272915 isoform X4 [Physcomitrella patens]
MKLGKSLRQYFSTKAESRRQEEASWDEDLIGDRNGKFGKNRVFWQGSLDSRGFPRAPAVEVRDIFRHCVRILGAYGNDIDGLIKPIREHEPQFDSRFVVDLQSPKAPRACPPYFIYVDHRYKEVSMYIRGLNLLHRRDYVVLLKNRKGEKPYEEGFVHHGMTEAAEWATEHVAPVLKEQLRSNKGYRLTIVGHSLGAGVAALFTMMLVKSPELVGLADPREIRAILFAPPRVMSVDLALKYAPYVNSVIYQDDFLPRVSTKSVKRVFLVTFPLTVVVVFTYWLKQTLQSKEDKETQRLYPPGKVYHFIYKQPGRRGDRPIRARVVPSAEGRFERIVLPSLGTVSNHSVLLLAKHLKKFDWPEELKDSWLISVLQTRKK